jgi:hypothetical protein
MPFRTFILGTGQSFIFRQNQTDTVQHLSMAENTAFRNASVGFGLMAKPLSGEISGDGQSPPPGLSVSGHDTSPMPASPLSDWLQ